ncbi:MAG TPA: CpsD/CapB family tyrosine-protein kinase [Casimicrobiaceae bacterium]|jgi:capsular exopolysaccharide synthesis family protein
MILPDPAAPHEASRAEHHRSEPHLRSLADDAHAPGSERAFHHAEPTLGAPTPHHRPHIHYTRTRVVDIAPQVFERHRVASLTADPKADAFRLLRTQLLLQMRQHGWRTLAVTSPNKGAGKSTIAFNLAVNFALEADHTALLVDADLRDPYIRDMLELEPGPGLADHLLGKASLANLFVHPNVGNLVILPGGAPVALSSELMRSPMMAKMVEELRGRYPDRLIVFDVPPILSGADTLALSAYMDATILLVEECKTTRDDIRASVELLRSSNLVGIVLNKSRELREPDPITRRKPGFRERFFGGRS